MGSFIDAKFFGDYINELTDKIKATGSEPKGKMLIFDKGNNSEENITKVLNLGYNIIGSLRPSAYKEIISTPVSELTEEVKIYKNIVRYKELKTKIYGEEKKVVITFDGKTKRKKIHTLEEYFKKIQKKVSDFQEDINRELRKPRNSKWESDKNVIEKANSLVAKQYSKLFDFGINRTNTRIEIILKIVPEEYDHIQLNFGKNLLFTNKMDLPAEEVIRLYRLKDFVEKLFQYLKDFKLILLEPQYHQLDRRIIVNTYLKVVSMQILAYLSKQLKQKNCSMGLFDAIDELRAIYKVRYINEETGNVKELPLSLNENQKELIQKLGLIV